MFEANEIFSSSASLDPYNFMTFIISILLNLMMLMNSKDNKGVSWGVFTCTMKIICEKLHYSMLFLFVELRQMLTKVQLLPLKHPTKVDRCHFTDGTRAHPEKCWNLERERKQ
mmetsp:Transcript_39206/g.57255  ORF Transcript_39206/g.57255 Transcript_39206/m.57255 type:complete len:113 (-) Transcript_39206:31-369(-)